MKTIRTLVPTLAALLLPLAVRAEAEADPGDAPLPHALNEDGYYLVDRPRAWVFPRDYGRHDGFQIEWWYFTGNLTAIDPNSLEPIADPAGTPRDFGFQITFFRSELAPKVPAPLAAKTHEAGTETTPAPTAEPSDWRTRDLYFGHFAISDIAAREFHHAERTSRAHPRLAGSSAETMDVHLLGWTCSIEYDDAGNELIRLRAADGTGEDREAIDLACRIERGPIFHGPGGLNTKGDQPGQASYYYSFTRLRTAGTITVGGQTFAVRGLTWMDQEFSSNQLSGTQEGWDWFSLQLDDGRDVMAYRLRGPDGGNDHAFATIVDGGPADTAAAARPTGPVVVHGTTATGAPPAAHAEAVRYTTDQVHLAGSDPWTSPGTGGRYPLTWKLRIADDFTATVRARFPGQELRTDDSTDISYFEGAVEVLDATGTPIGRGYMELTGYAESLADAF